ncbi:MAG: response regulator transcription factor [Bacteriovoracaceae bacterium]|nr:response regulator transcription factor [Bacteriovoracaceae bacterium]
MVKVLLVEDDRTLGQSIQHFLKQEGFEISWSTSIQSAKESFGITNSVQKFDIILLDWMLPDGQGIDWLKDMRSNRIKTPVIMLTAKSELLDKVIGLESGADDYMTKPFEPRELVARMRVQLRKNDSSQVAQIHPEKIIKRGPLLINFENREVFFNENLTHLTKMEFDLLVLLAESPGKPFTRDEMLNKVWGFEFTPATRTIDTHVLQLRQKFGDDVIDTVRGIGYRFNKNYHAK